MSDPRSILLVAYFYPPCRDTGAQRPAAMARHLRGLGHSVAVLTTSAYGEIPGDAERDVIRTRDAQRWRARLRGRDRIDALFDSDTYSSRPHPLSRLIVPEPLALAWAPFARRRALALHRKRTFDAVITTSPPESAHSVGRALRRRGMPWVADLRDAWNFEPLRPQFPLATQRRRDERLERQWLSEADVVVGVSRPAIADLRERLGIDAELIPNGWDPQEVQTDSEASPGVELDHERVSLVYTGRFGSYGRDPRPLVEALERLAADDPGTASRLELVVAGPLTEQEELLFAREVSPARVSVVGSLPRERALALQREADCLLLLAQPTRSQLLNFKLFEYLASGSPILALAAGTEAGRVVEEIGGVAVRADDPAAIAKALADLVANPPSPPPRQALAAYTYPAPAERMAAAVEQAIARARD